MNIGTKHIALVRRCPLAVVTGKPRNLSVFVWARMVKTGRHQDTLVRMARSCERMTTEIADAIMEGLNPSGVAVVIQAEHLCMIMRGIKKPGSNVITSAIRGAFRRQAASRAEFFSLIQGKQA